VWKSTRDGNKNNIINEKDTKSTEDPLDVESFKR
jgi:hypothetical protein